MHPTQPGGRVVNVFCKRDNTWIPSIISIVFAVVLFLLLFLCICCCCKRRTTSSVNTAAASQDNPSYQPYLTYSDSENQDNPFQYYPDQVFSHQHHINQSQHLHHNERVSNPIANQRDIPPTYEDNPFQYYPDQVYSPPHHINPSPYSHNNEPGSHPISNPRDNPPTYEEAMGWK